MSETYEKLLTGVAYHGNRIMKHVRDDMEDIVKHNMNLVVHMFSHNDWDRHLGVMKEMIDISKYYGLEVWIDNWGIGGPPGDKSHFLQYHPEAHQVYMDGSIDPVSACYNSESFVQFTKDWLETVRGFGGETIFWDEPRFKSKKAPNGDVIRTCRCAACQKRFEEKYGKPMPTEMTDEVAAFQTETMTNYFDIVTTYAASMGMKNVAGVMPHTLHYTSDILNLPHLDNFGTDPYWSPKRHPERDPYDYVYTQTLDLIKTTREHGKQAHSWIQVWDLPAGTEDDIILGTDAAYDAGARTIIDWSYRGAESNTYRCDNCDRAWQIAGEAMARIRARHFDEIRRQRLEAYKK